MSARRITSSVQGQRGQSMTEYILIVTLIAIACIAAVKIFGQDIKAAFGNASKQVREATQPEK